MESRLRAALSFWKGALAAFGWTAVRSPMSWYFDHARLMTFLDVIRTARRKSNFVARHLLSGRRALTNHPWPSPMLPALQRLTHATYVSTAFLSALLLFSVQPMVAKMVLPKLGGSPGVWAVSMCFFQAALLLGYCYAFGLSRLRRQG